LQRLFYRTDKDISYEVDSVRSIAVVRHELAEEVVEIKELQEENPRYEVETPYTSPLANDRDIHLEIPAVKSHHLCVCVYDGA